MVKDIITFIRWYVGRLTWDSYAMMLAGGLISYGWFNSKDLVLYSGTAVLLLTAVGIVIGEKWRVWKSERRSLFETIKGSK